jgi:type I restriction enzyme R subunit
VFSSNGDGFVFHNRTGACNPREANMGLEVFPSPADQWVRCRAWKGLDAEAEQVVLQDYFDDAARRPPRGAFRCQGRPRTQPGLRHLARPRRVDGEER